MGPEKATQTKISVDSKLRDSETCFDASRDFYKEVLELVKKTLTVGKMVTEVECALCNYDFEFLPTEEWPCHGKHVFCSVCTKKWENRNPGGTTPCPICKAPKKKWSTVIQDTLKIGH